MPEPTTDDLLAKAYIARHDHPLIRDLRAALSTAEARAVAAETALAQIRDAHEAWEHDRLGDREVRAHVSEALRGLDAPIDDFLARAAEAFALLDVPDQPNPDQQNLTEDPDDA